MLRTNLPRGAGNNAPRRVPNFTKRPQNAISQIDDGSQPPSKQQRNVDVKKTNTNKKNVNFAATNKSYSALMPAPDVPAKRTPQMTNVSSPNVNLKNQGNTSVAIANRKSKVVDQEMDMVFLTATIEKALEWYNYKNVLPFVCQVFGFIDSAVTYNVEKTMKSFLLRDSTSAVRCCFYEMDRPMPKFMRGQWCRLAVNVIDGKSFQCLSIRLATPAERRNYPKFVAICTKTVNARIEKMNEPKV